MEQAVDLARQKNLRVKAADADARTMDSMRKEALAPFWPQLSANGYFNDQRLAPNVFTSAGNTMARNYQVFNADQTRDANFTAMYSLFSGGRDYYGYQAAARRAEAGREMRRGAEVDVAMQARLDYIAALREAENVRVTGELLRDVDERLRLTREMFDGRTRAALLRAARRDRARERAPDGRDGAQPGRAGPDRPEDHARRGPVVADHAGRPAPVPARGRLRRGRHPPGGRDASRPPDGDQAAGGGPGRGARRLRQLLPPGLGELHVRRAVVEESQRGVDDRRRVLGGRRGDAAALRRVPARERASTRPRPGSTGPPRPRASSASRSRRRSTRPP